MEVKAKRGESIVALAQAELPLHCDQLGTLAPCVGGKGRRKEQGYIGDIVGGGGRNKAEAWLMHLLKFAKLHELTTKCCALFYDVGRKVVWVMLFDKRTQFTPRGTLAVRIPKQKITY